MNTAITSATDPADACGTSRRVTTVNAVTGQDVARRLPAALAGDQDAWNAIVEEYTQLLWWIARSYRLSDATAADVVQTVWLQLVRFGDRIDDPTRLAGWLATTARRESLRRTRSRDIPSEFIGDDADHTELSTEERLVDSETLGIVMAAFHKLSEADQQLLELVCAVPPKSYEEIAAILGKSKGSIGPTRQRVLDKLRVLVEEMGLT